MKRKAILLVAAGVIAALGATLVFLYVQGVDDKAVAGQQTVNVLTVSSTLHTGDTLSDALAAGNIQQTAVPRADVLPGALTSVNGMEDLAALTDIFPGEQLLPQKFGTTAHKETIQIPEGTMAVSVQLTDPSRVAGFVTPGSDVAVFLSGKPEGITPDGSTVDLPTFSRLLLQKVEVIGVGASTVLSTTTTDTTGTATTEQVPTTILTLALTQDEAERVIYGSQNGTLSLALLNDDSNVNPSRGVTANDLFR